LLQAVLPLRVFGIEELLAMVEWIQVKKSPCLCFTCEKEIATQNASIVVEIGEHEQEAVSLATYLRVCICNIL
jgi:hypothetical protein